ncbi:MAG TPA: GNAT family N-acetyltransferase [bacterium]|nr:GNAT family N-acetyltransferase [bacterium]HQO35962.1 GNAT family N-acetyltransferase [bacterium]HQP98624.1 GNAT family N-acetyltransferase [bacterium]
MLRDYPKEVTLKDGRSVAIRPLTSEDERALWDFYASLSPEDRRYLRHNVADPSIVREWTRNINHDRVVPIVAENPNGEVVSAATLHRHPHSWSPHVADIRLATHAGYRRIGLGMLMAREIFSIAMFLRIEKVVAEVVEDQIAAIRILEKMGFEREALLKNHVIDHEHEKRNLVIMSAYLSSLWEQITDMVMDSFRVSAGDY